MLSSRRLLANIFRSFSTNQPPQTPSTTNQSDMLVQAQRLQSQKVPIHLKPYDKKKYQVPSKHIKRNSGYSMIQVQPFPRARIMKICYNILADIRKDIPEDYVFRILVQEKTKYIMQVIDKEDNPEVIQSLIGQIPIQIFTRNLADLLEVIQTVRKLKPWTQQFNMPQKAGQQFIKQHAFKPDPKWPKYQKSDRSKQNIL